MNLHLQHITWENYTAALYIPDAREVQEQYYRQKQNNPETPFPHWTRLWPASTAIAAFLLQHPQLYRQKTVLELAAGLGLPSLIAAREAASVYCSDYLPEAVDTIRQSIQYNHLHNASAQLLNWHHLPDTLTADVLILSDINYDPAEFDHLYQVLTRFLQQNTTLILSTPQRLMAKTFIEKLLPFCTQQHEIISQQAPITILILENPASPSV